MLPRQKSLTIASSRDRLREAAKILFAERGFEATTPRRSAAWRVLVSPNSSNTPRINRAFSKQFLNIPGSRSIRLCGWPLKASASHGIS